MPEDSDERRLISRTVQLGDEQWRWLDKEAERTYSKSASAELRKLVAAAMEQREVAAT